MAIPPNPPPNPSVKPPSLNPEVAPPRAAPRPNPLHGAHVAAATVPPESPPLVRMNIHGVPPAPNMAPAPNVDDEIVNEATEAEMAAGKEALAVYSKRTQAEHDYGAKMLARRSRVTQESKGG